MLQITLWPFDIRMHDKGLADCDDWGGADSAEYMEAVSAHCVSHRLTFAARRASLDEDQCLQLQALESLLVAGISECIEDTRNFQWHMQLRRSVEVCWRDCWYSPADHTLYTLWDHMAHRL